MDRRQCRQKNRHLLVELAGLPADVHDERVRALITRATQPRTREAAKDAAKETPKQDPEPAGKEAR